MLRAMSAHWRRRQHSQWLRQLRRTMVTPVSMVPAVGCRHVTIVVYGTASRACLLPASHVEPRPGTCRNYVLRTQMSRPRRRPMPARTTSAINKLGHHESCTRVMRQAARIHVLYTRSCNLYVRVGHGKTKYVVVS
jgi:hypothetical protein